MNGAFADGVFLSKSHSTKLVAFFSDFFYLFAGKFSAIILFSAQTSVFINHVFGVIGGSTNEKMFGVNAKNYITLMANKLAFRYSTNVNSIANSVRSFFLPFFVGHRSVSVGLVYGPKPKPAGFCYSNPFPKALLNWCPGRTFSFFHLSCLPQFITNWKVK